VYDVDTPGVTAAKYLTQDIPSYRGNPWLEALPPILSKNQWFAALRRKPTWDADVRHLDGHLRLHALNAIDEWFEPSGQTVSLAQAFDRVLRAGLARRSPLHPEHYWLLRRMSRAPVGSSLNIALAARRPARVCGLVLLGASGMGKSTALIDRVLATFPRVIQHTAYQGRDIPHRQLVHLTVEARSSHSLKTLCLDCITSVDALLGTNYARMLGIRTATGPGLMGHMRTIAALHGLGALIIDEFQQLARAKQAASEECISQLLSLSNVVGVPVIMVGTPKATDIVSAEARLANRTTLGGTHEWDPFAFDEDWRKWTGLLFEYQVLKKPTAHTVDLSRALHGASKGIVGVATAIFQLAQIIAITSRDERLTTDLLAKRALAEVGQMRHILADLGLNRIEQSLLDEHRVRRLRDVSTLRAPDQPKSNPPRTENH
jgi:hypothetical protein